MCLHTRVRQILSQVAHHIGTYLLTSFYGIKRLGVFLLPLGWGGLVHHGVIPQH